MIIGATSTSSPVAAGAETSGAELVDMSAEARGSVSGADVSGRLTAASTVLGAVTTGSAWVASETPASGCGLAVCGGVVSALAPDGLAEACVDEPVDGLLALTVVGDEPLGLVTADVDTPDPLAGGLTFSVVGAFTDG